MLGRPQYDKYVLILVGIDRLPVAFREFFATATYKQAAQFFHYLTPEQTGAQDVVLAAVEYGSPSLRRMALSSLQRFPSPVVITTLIETVKRNNYRDEPDVEEVEGALSALVEIDVPRAHDFLEEVAQRRQWLKHVHRKEIRKVLSKLLEKKRDFA